MSNFILDYSKKQTLQISNDAFYFLYYGEEPLDENNLEEANDVSEMFSNNFYIEDDWKAVDDSDLIECTFIPYIEDQADYDEYEDLTRHIQQQINGSMQIMLEYGGLIAKLAQENCKAILRFIQTSMVISVFIPVIKMRTL